VILVLISPRKAGLPFARWLPEVSGRLVAVTEADSAVGDGFAEVVTVADYTDDDDVLDAARAAAKRHRPRAVLALAEVDVERAAVLRGELGLPGLDTVAATVYRDKLLMKVFARAAGMRVPRFAAVTTVGEIVDFMAAHPGRVVVKPRRGTGSAGVYVLDTPEQAADLEGVVSTSPCQVEEFVAGVLHRVDALRVEGDPIAAVVSRSTDQGCLEHWTDAPFGSRTMNAADPATARLVHETWRLVDALPSPRTICVHAKFFVTSTGEIVLCEVAPVGGPIPVMLRRVLGIDPQELWARIECGLPTDLDAVRERVRTAPRAALYGVPPGQGRVQQLPEKPSCVTDFTLNTYSAAGGQHIARPA
jgi:biotin carboxylase